MCSDGMPLNRDPPLVLRTELLHESERTRVSRLATTAGSVIRKEPLGPGAQRRLGHEVEILKHLSDVEGVVHLADPAPLCPGSLLLADVGGMALSEWGVPWKPAALVDLAEALARAVAQMHRQGVVHLDINPANIVVSPDRRVTSLIDFALATTFAAIRQEFQHSSEIVGTVPYLAPERTGRTGRPVDQRADLYAVGATLYELATGAPPFGTGPPLQMIHNHLARVPVWPSRINPVVPEELSDIIMHLLEKEPDDRYRSADGLIYDLALLSRGAAVVRPGEHDLPKRPLMTARLAGRDREIGELRAAFAEVMTGRCPGVVLSGAPGVGKTSLANELRPVAASHDGWFVAGKFDQYRHGRENNGLMQAFRALGRLLLAEPEESLVAVRSRIEQTLGPNTGLAASMVPELVTLLAVAPEPGDPMTAQARAQRSSIDVLRAVASRERPVVFFIDDLQWAGRFSLGFIDSILGGEEEVDGLLLVGAFRDSEVDAAHPLASMIPRWSRQAVRPRILQLGNLTPEGQEAMVAGLLKLPSPAATQLAQMIAPLTGGNPYNTVELLNSLRQDGILTPSEGRWRWDRAELRRRLTHADVAELVTTRVAAMPPKTQETLAVMACLGSRAELDLLEVATGLAGDELERRLAPACAAGLLVLDSDGRPSVRFHHDRSQRSVLAHLLPEVRQATRLGLARRLAGRSEFFASAAEQYLLVADSVHDPQERRLMVTLFRRAADEIGTLADTPLVARFLSAAAKLIDPSDTGQLLAVRMDLHAALYRLGRLEEADDEYEAISRLCADPAQCAPATAIQIGSIFNRGRVGEALRLGLDALRRVGLVIPDRDHLDAEIDRGLDVLSRWITETSESDDLRRSTVSDPARVGAVQLIHRLMPPAYCCDQTMLAWLAVTTMQMWARDGPDPALVGPGCYIGSVIVSRRHDYRTSFRILRRILAVSRARTYEPDVWRAQLLYIVDSAHWFEPIENSLPAARSALECLVRDGDLLNACYAHFVIICDLLDCAPSLEILAAEVDEAVAFTARTGNGRTEEVFRAYRRLVRALRGRPVESAADEASEPSLLAVEPDVLVILHVTRALAAAILDHPDELDRHTAAVTPLLPTFEATYISTTARVLRALALAAKIRATDAPQRDAMLLELDGLVAWLGERAADAPANFRHLLRLIEAERAWAVGDFQGAVFAFDAAQLESSARARPWHRALILEHAARFYLAHGVVGAGHGLLVAARGLYLDWGAAAKVSQLDYVHPALAAEPASASSAMKSTVQPPVRRSTVMAGTLDLLGIVAASRALSSATSIDGLRVKVGQILGELTGATAVHLLLRDEEQRTWWVPVDEGGAVSLEEASRRRLLPTSVIWYAERTRGPVVIADAARDDRFGQDRYFAGLDRCSLLAVPILIRSELRAMLLLENRMIRGAFTTERLEGIMLIAAQLAVCLDNSLVYASLERKVAERTEELATSNRRLEQISVTDALTGLANRRRLDEVLDAVWRQARRQATPVGFAMIDIDHFKAYNDHFGHAAGDRCLQRVAACVAASIRDKDLAARYGGEEFAIVMPGADADAATRIAGRLRSAVAELAESHPRVADQIVTVSIGVMSMVPTPKDDVKALVKLADAALYRAKDRGRNRVEAALPNSERDR